MRSTRLFGGLGLAAFLLLVAAKSAAQTPKPPGENPKAAPDPRLDQLLARWETETQTIRQSMAAELRCTRKENTFNRKRVSTGWIKFMRPDLARVELTDTEDPSRYERYVCTGSHIYNFSPAEKTIYVYPLKQNQKGQLPDEGPWQFLADMKANKMKQRYDLRITKVTDAYTYVDVYPIFPQDMQDFTYARLVILNKADKPVLQPMVGLPIQLYWVEPNKNEVTWDVLKIHKDSPQTVKRLEFEKPELPAKDWKWGETQALRDTPRGADAARPTGGKPRVVRPQTPDK